MKKSIIIGAVVILCSIFAAANLNNIFAKEPQGELTSFNFGLTGTAYKSGYHYSAKLDKDELSVHMYYYTSRGIVEKKRAVNNDSKFLKDLDSLIKEQKLYKWNGFRKSAKHVLDGEGFGLRAVYRNGKEQEVISASGSNAFPDGYDVASKAVAKYFQENVDKLPTVKSEYSFAEVKPEIMAALKYLHEQGIIMNNVGGEVFSFSAKGDADLAMIIIDAAMDPGHSFQVRTRNHKLLSIMIVAADGKNIAPKYAVVNSIGQLEPADQEKYEQLILRKEL